MAGAGRAGRENVTDSVPVRKGSRGTRARLLPFTIRLLPSGTLANIGVSALCVRGMRITCSTTFSSSVSSSLITPMMQPPRAFKAQYDATSTSVLLKSFPTNRSGSPSARASA